MENQHRQIKGYRELSQDEINLMNQIKALGPQIEAVIAAIRASESEQKLEIDRRWLSIGTTDLQTGLMALTRSVARPTFF